MNRVFTKQIYYGKILLDARDKIIHNKEELTTRVIKINKNSVWLLCFPGPIRLNMKLPRLL